MKYFRKGVEVWAFEEDGSQDHLITSEFTPMTAEEIDAHINPPVPEPTSEQILARFQAAHDAHLNNAARAKKYDSIHTAALRAGYPGPYQAEGLAFAQWMDACNQTGYQILAAVQAGEQETPESVEAYLAMLPVLTLPEE